MEQFKTFLIIFIFAIQLSEKIMILCFFVFFEAIPDDEIYQGHCPTSPSTDVNTPEDIKRFSFLLICLLV